MPASTLFIPDISGFTKFVKSTEIMHAGHIIEEIIELIMKEGSKHFEVAEIEGDAVFFYKYGQKLSLNQSMEYAKDIFQAFHRYIKQYDTHRLCHCGACTSAVDLKLKFVVHSGKVTLQKYSGNNVKPFGSPVIEVHRLLKTKIGVDQYVLFSKAFLDHAELEKDGSSSYKDEELGEIPFDYVLIDEWAENLQVEEYTPDDVQPDFIVEGSTVVNMGLEDTYSFITDFRFRELWNPEADQIIFEENRVNRVGSEHYCIVDGKNLYFTTFKPKSTLAQRAYGEILKNPAPMKYLEVSYVLEAIDENETMINMAMSGQLKWWFQRLLLPLIKSQMNKNLTKVLEKIQELLNDHSIEEYESADRPFEYSYE